VLNLFHSYYVFAKYAKAWEHTIRCSGSGVQGSGVKGQGKA
jgi:hypothetical protein